MIDVLAAMLIVPTVLFSLLFYQMDHLKAVHAAFYRVIAINQLDNLMAMNRTSLPAYSGHCVPFMRGSVLRNIDSQARRLFKFIL